LSEDFFSRKIIICFRASNSESLKERNRKRKRVKRREHRKHCREEVPGISSGTEEKSDSKCTSVGKFCEGGSAL
jgi:hypothetical protein